MVTPSPSVLADAVATVLGAGQPSVVWSDCGDELVVHAGDVAVRTEPDAVVVDVPVATEETGPALLSVAMVLGEDASAVAVTDPRPWGRRELADRWGTLLQEAVWSAVAPRMRVLAAERGNG